MTKRTVKSRPTEDVEVKKMLMVNCNLSYPSCMPRASVHNKYGIRDVEMFSVAEDY